ncbi:MAG: hypothetical protein ACM34E_14420 [Acidobacteriota bacterium]
MNTVDGREYQICEGEERLLTQLRSLANLNLGGFRQQHPDRNFQSSPHSVDDADRPISSLRSA